VDFERGGHSNQKRIAELPRKMRCRDIRSGRFVASGGLVSYGADQAEPMGAPLYSVDKILKGTKPADIPLSSRQSLTHHKSETAKQIGLTIPRTCRAANR